MTVLWFIRTNYFESQAFYKVQSDISSKTKTRFYISISFENSHICSAIQNMNVHPVLLNHSLCTKRKDTMFIGKEDKGTSRQ